MSDLQELCNYALGVSSTQLQFNDYNSDRDAFMQIIIIESRGDPKVSTLKIIHTMFRINMIL
jgi:hypothetical protein